MKKNKSGAGKIIVLIILIAAVAVGVMYQMGIFGTKSSSVTQQEKTEAEILIEKDLNTAYPATPKEVVKLYSRFTQCIYNSKYEEEDFEKLVDQLRLMYDEELLAGNPKETQRAAMEVEIAEYKSADALITAYQVDEEIVYNEMDEKEYCELTSTFFLRQGKKYFKTHEDFVLRKDASGKWKIFGWKKSDTQEEVTESEAVTETTAVNQ